MEGWTRVRELGRGSGGAVFLCVNDKTGSQVALKRFIEIDPNVQRAALVEAQLLRLSRRHPNIVRLLDAFRSGSGRIYLLFEYVPHTLSRVISAHPSGLQVEALRSVAWQLLQALAYLHRHNIVHRDVKPQNVLITTDGTVKLCDFGFARVLHPHDSAGASRYVVTRWYRAPELLVGDAYGSGVDIWSLGALFMEAALGRPLLAGSSHVDQLALTLGTFPLEQLNPRHRRMILRNTALHPTSAHGLSQFVTQQTLAQRLFHLDKDAQEFATACLQPDPALRPSALTLMQLPYFAGMQYAQLTSAAEVALEVQRLMGTPAAAGDSAADAADGLPTTGAPVAPARPSVPCPALPAARQSEHGAGWALPASSRHGAAAAFASSACSGEAASHSRVPPLGGDCARPAASSDPQGTAAAATSGARHQPLPEDRQDGAAGAACSCKPCSPSQLVSHASHCSNGSSTCSSSSPSGSRALGKLPAPCRGLSSPLGCRASCDEHDAPSAAAPTAGTAAGGGGGVAVRALCPATSFRVEAVGGGQDELLVTRSRDPSPRSSASCRPPLGNRGGADVDDAASGSESEEDDSPGPLSPREGGTAAAGGGAPSVGWSLASLISLPGLKRLWRGGGSGGGVHSHPDASGRVAPSCSSSREGRSQGGRGDPCGDVSCRSGASVSHPSVARSDTHDLGLGVSGPSTTARASAAMRRWSRALVGGGSGGGGKVEPSRADTSGLAVWSDDGTGLGVERASR